MPTSIQQLEITYGLKYINSFKWGTPITEKNNGIYIISTNKNKDYLPLQNNSISFDENQIDTWLINAPNILLNSQGVQKKELTNQLKGFWLPDESNTFS